MWFQQNGKIRNINIYNFQHLWVTEVFHFDKVYFLLFLFRDKCFFWLDISYRRKNFFCRREQILNFYAVTWCPFRCSCLDGSHRGGGDKKPICDDSKLPLKKKINTVHNLISFLLFSKMKMWFNQWVYRFQHPHFNKI